MTTQKSKLAFTSLAVILALFLMVTGVRLTELHFARQRVEAKLGAAISSNDYNRVKAAIATNPMATNLDHRVLLLATYHDDIETVRILVRRGVPTVSPVTGDCPLIYAANKLNVEMTKLLLDHGADPNCTEGHGFKAADMWNDYAEKLDEEPYKTRAHAIRLMLKTAGATPNC
jgi:hypothetical protein